MPKVYNCHKPGVPDDAVLVDRRTKFGNPFHIGKHGNRQEVIWKYRKMLFRNERMMAQVKEELRGKDLVCNCAPLPCHADVLLEVANA